MWGSSVHTVRTMFLRCVCLSFTVAFHSLYIQLPGLYGDHGVTPVRSLLSLDRLEKESLMSLLWERPTLLWLTPYTGLGVLQVMEILCLLGSILGLICTMFPSLATSLSLVWLHLSYLSLFSVGGTFLNFQWDTLLLETGVLAIIAAPLWPGYQDIPLPKDHTSLALVRWLLFRMMFASGAVKLTSGCKAWWGLTAMPTHYFSQCLPTPLAWFASLQPDWLHRLSVAATYIIEIPLTFLFFAPTTSLRKFTGLAQAFLMFVIMASGNYNFFNFLYLALCLSLADDSWFTKTRAYSSPPHPVTTCLCCLLHLSVYTTLGWAVGQVFNLKVTTDYTISSSIAFTRTEFDIFLSYSVPIGLFFGAVCLAWAGLLSLMRAVKERSPVLSTITTLLHLSLAVSMFLLSLPSYTGQLHRATYDQLPREIKQADRALGKLQLTHSYGLFRSMTGVGGRPEVVLEGAMNPQGPWTEYDFRYKPGNISEAPKFCLPHQPRLDWQMWFAALGSYEYNPWLVSLVYRLLDGQTEVLKLLSPESSWLETGPPTYIRARSYIYTYTDSIKDRDWWVRREVGEYLPILSRDHKPLLDFLTSQGILGLKQESVSKSLVIGPLLSWMRKLSDSTPHHIQIWSYAWMAVPLLVNNKVF